MEQKVKTVFEQLNSLNVNGHTETRKGDNGRELTYLSWAWAWSEVMKRFPDSTYEVVKTADGLPYFGEPNVGYMVYTRVTIEGITREMWLPVMNGANKPMRAEPYSYKTKYGEKYVEAIDMFAVNKTIMRCLAKCLAMFGCALYLYTGEDLPEQAESPEEDAPKPKKEMATVSDRKEMFSIAKTALGNEYATTLKKWFAEMGVTSSEELTKAQVHDILDRIGTIAEEFIGKAF